MQIGLLNDKSDPSSKSKEYREDSINITQYKPTIITVSRTAQLSAVLRATITH